LDQPLVLVVASALASLLAILAELGGANRQPAHLALAAITILLSWAFTHTIFAIHHAHEYYSEKAHKGGGLNFPGDEPPDYWDFVYFSFVVGMTSQVSDVAVSSSVLRRLVAAHGAVSFVFNATLLGPDGEHRRQCDMIFRSESPRLVTLRDDLRAVTVLNAILRVELPGDLVRRTPNHWVRTKCNHLIARIDAYHLEWKIIEHGPTPSCFGH
jgi:Protein of unknown function (DUF1345)